MWPFGTAHLHNNRHPPRANTPGAECVVYGVEAPLILQFSIALCTGLVAATFVPPVRRMIPRPVEVILWVAFVSVCVIGVTSITDANARELTTSAAWGIDQLITTFVGLTIGGVASWLVDNRFAIDRWLLIAAGCDLIALTFLRSMHTKKGWQPRVRLRDWMELPTATPAVVTRERASHPAVVLGRRLTALTAIAAAALVAELAEIAIWIRDVFMPVQRRRLAQAAAAGRAGSRARLEGVRDGAAHFAFAARAWYAAAGVPAVSTLAVKAGAAVRTVRESQPALKAGQVIDIRALLSAESIGWYGPLAPLPPANFADDGEEDAAEPQRSDRLAS